MVLIIGNSLAHILPLYPGASPRRLVPERTCYCRRARRARRRERGGRECGAHLGERDRLGDERLRDLHGHGAAGGNGVARRHGAGVEAGHEGSTRSEHHSDAIWWWVLHTQAGRQCLSVQAENLRLESGAVGKRGPTENADMRWVSGPEEMP